MRNKVSTGYWMPMMQTVIGKGNSDLTTFGVTL